MKIGQLENVEIKNNTALVSINPKIYSLSAIFSAAYCLCDKAFILIDGHPAEEVLVELSPKNNSELMPILESFAEELINYVVYEIRDERNLELRNSIIEKLLISNKYEKYSKSVEIVSVEPAKTEHNSKIDNKK